MLLHQDFYLDFQLFIKIIYFNIIIVCVHSNEYLFNITLLKTKFFFLKCIRFYFNFEILQL